MRSNLIIAPITKLGAGLFGILLQLYLARVLTASDYGQISLILSYSAIAFILTIGPLGKFFYRSYLLQNSADASEQRLSTLKTHVIYSVAAALVGSICASLLSAGLQLRQELVLSFFLFYLFGSAFSDLTTNYLQGRGRVFLGEAFLALRACFVLLTVIWVGFSFKLSISNVICIIGVCYFLFGSVFFLVYQPGSWASSAPLTVSLGRILPFIGLGGVAAINNQIDIVMLGWLSDFESVGLYRTCTVVLAAITTIEFSLVRVVIPGIYNEKMTSELIQNLITKRSRIIFFMITALCFLLLPFSDFLFQSVLEASDVRYRTVLLLLFIAQVISAFFPLAGQVLVINNMEKSVFYVTALCALLNIILNYAAIKGFNLIGAAFATGLSLVLRNLMLSVLCRKKLGIKVGAFL